MANLPVLPSPVLDGGGPIAALLDDPLSQDARRAKEVEDDTAFAATVTSRKDEGDRARRGVEKLWKECIAFIEGVQHIIADLQSPVWLNVQANAPPGSERVVNNVLFDHGRRLHAQLTRPSFAPTVSAMTDMPEDYDAARLGQALCRNAFHLQRVSQIKRALTWWIIVPGCCWVETYFDRTEGRNGRAGMVLRSPFQVYRDPRFTEWDRCRWAIVTETAARSDVLDRYAESYEARTGRKLVDVLPKDTTVKSNTWMPEVSGRPGGDATGIMTPPPAAKDAVTVYRYYERPSAKHPRGRHGVVVEQTTVHRSDLSTPGNRIPLTPFGYWVRPWDLEGRSPIGMSLHLQRLANYSLGRWYEHIKRWAAGYLLKDTLSGITRGSITNQPDIITHNPGHPPKFEFPPFGNTQGYVAFMNFIASAIENRMALPPVMRGEMPKGNKAAKSLEILREISEEVGQPIVADLADSWVEVWKQMLGWMQQEYEDDDITSIVGADKQGVAMHFRRGSIPANWEDRILITVDTGGALPTGRLARMQTILELSRKDKLFGNPGTPEHARQLKQAIGFDAGYLESETDLDRSIAQQENTHLRMGQMLPVHEFDDDQTHIAEHLAYIKQLTITGEPAQFTATIMQHVNQHRAQLANKHKDLQPVAEAAINAGQTPPPPPGAEGQKNVAAPQVRAPMGQA
jgi:hypothetical protein